MAEHIVCVTADGGLPLFTRTKPGRTPLPFPVMASLNGVHLFARNRDVNLVSTLTKDHKIVWKTYEDSIILIAMIRIGSNNTKCFCNSDDYSEIFTTSISDSHYLRFLDNIFHALVLLAGLDELCKHSNVERLKKDLRASYKLIDSFLETGQGNIQLFGTLTHCTDMVLCDETPLLQQHLNAFVEAAASTYGCLVADGRVVCATEKWWMLTGLELSLLGRLISVLGQSATSCDIPVYLPHSSANIPHRLLVFTLVTNSVHSSLSRGSVRVCVLCGPEPSLMEVQSRLVERFWRSGVDTLQKSVMSCASGFPPNLSSQLPKGLLGFLLINRESCQCVPSTSPFIKSSGTLNNDVDPAIESVLREEDIPRALADFYMATVGTVFHLPEVIESDTEKLELTRNIAQSNIPCLAHYLCQDSHKAFALQRGPYQIFCLYHPILVPTYALRNATCKTLDVLTIGGFF